MVGGYALRYALEHPGVGRVTSIGRRKVRLSHPNLTEVLHPDFADCSSLESGRTDLLSGHLYGDGDRFGAPESHR
jgi:hypothetical protein